MRRFAFVLPALAFLSLSIGAQEVRQQGAILMLPAYTDAQLWEGLSGNFTAFVIAGISQAKALGKTPEFFGRYTGDLAAPGWGPPKSGTAIAFARGMAFNFAGLPGASVQVTATSDTSAALRFRRTYLSFFGPSRSALGISVDEYDRAMNAIVSTVAEYLGLRSSVRFDGEWASMEVAGRGSAAGPSMFPVGTYVAAFSDTALKAHPDLAGNWDMTYMPDGHFALRHNGAPFVQGDYEVNLDQLMFPRADTGSPGVTGCSTPAAYHWMVDPRTKALSFERLSDECGPRVDWTTNVTLTKKS